MKNLIYKEFTLATPLLTFLFLGFSAMTFIPGYPILCGAFFVCFGIFQSYQVSREYNDILYTVLLPIKKSDAVKSKYISAAVLQAAAFVLFFVFSCVRMMFLSDAEMYKSNVMMNANFVFLAFVLLIFAFFNAIFIGGFFKTAYNYGKPFIIFIVVCFFTIGIAETLHHLPRFGWINAENTELLWQQIPVLIAAAVFYILVTVISCKISQNKFEKTDL